VQATTTNRAHSNNIMLTTASSLTGHLRRCGTIVLEIGLQTLIATRDGEIMRLCARIILCIIGALLHNWANPA